MGVCYMGTRDSSGYGQAARTDITSLFLSGVDITTELISQMMERAYYSWSGELCESLDKRQIPYKIKILHVTPDIYPNYMEKGKYHIARLIWETDRLPKNWVNPCNQMQEIWCASEPQMQMIKNSGVTVPIKWFPEPIDTTIAEYDLQPFIVPNFDGFVFYGVFQWILRKNPEALVKTFLKTFDGIENVCLVLKTYGSNYSEKEFNKIKDQVAQWKLQLNLKKAPRIFLVNKLLSTTEIFRLHKMGGVYVNASCGEGWNIGAIEAALMGNAIISTGTTGFADYFPKDSYYPIEAKLVEAVQVPSIPFYTSDQKWLDIDRDQLGATMLEVYKNGEEARARGKKAQDYVKAEFNYFKVGEAMKARLGEIEKFL